MLSSIFGCFAGLEHACVCVGPSRAYFSDVRMHDVRPLYTPEKRELAYAMALTSGCGTAWYWWKVSSEVGEMWM
jgi:hypothetical protein